MFWQPPLLDAATGERASALAESAGLLAALVARGLRTICFAKSRKATELVFRIARETLQAEGRDEAAARLAPYRAGYTAEARRQIEADLVTGELLGVVATDALELGIDIGLLDCAIATGFPGTVASLRQQWGRAGRRSEGLAVFIPGEDGLDQFFTRHPEALLTASRRGGDPRSDEPRDPDRPRPRRRGGGAADAAGRRRARRGRVRLCGGARRGGRARADAGRPRLARDELAGGRVMLRSASAEAVAVVEAATGTLLGMVEEARALWTVHEGAVYLHRGDAYLAAARPRTQVALVEPFHGRLYTQPRRETETRILRVLARPERRAGVAVARRGRGQRPRGRLPAARSARARRPGHRSARAAGAPVPTRALWFEPPDELLEEAGGDLLGALHAAEHTLISVLPLYAMCDRWDIGGLSTNHHEQTVRPTIFVYEGHPGGVGFAARPRQLRGARRRCRPILAECPCESGCPSCVQSPKCGNLNEMLDKGAAGRLLASMSRRADAADAA